MDQMEPQVGSVVYAGFWLRFVAVIVDSFILNVASYLIRTLTSNGVYFLVSIVGGWLYYSLMESSEYQATIGKMALGIRVTDESGNRISFGRATGRYFAKILSALIIGIGFIMAGFTKRKQGLHDLLAETLVVKKSPNPAI
jgi:uncharacterized RDD family membrane protein YckC